MNEQEKITPQRAQSTEQINFKLDTIIDSIKLLQVDTPRLSRNESKKYLGVGEENYRMLKTAEFITEYTDPFGKKYCLRHELNKYLTDKRPFSVKREQLKKALNRKPKIISIKPELKEATG